MSTDVLPATASETFGPVRIDVADGVATVVVDSPPVNAMGHDVLSGLEQAAERLGKDESVRAIVLTGGGTKAFMAGADIAAFEEIRARPRGMEEHSAWAGGVLGAWGALPQPVIAAVQAHAVGGGLEIALATDLIVADPAVKLGLPEVKLGLIPGGGGTQRLGLRVGRAKAFRMMLLGAVVGAEQAERIGLVDQISASGEVVAEAQALAATIAAMPRVAVQAIKALTVPELDERILLERATFLQVAAADDFNEGLAAFAEKRAPVFSHR